MEQVLSTAPPWVSIARGSCSGSACGNVSKSLHACRRRVAWCAPCVAAWCRVRAQCDGVGARVKHRVLSENSKISHVHHAWCGVAVDHGHACGGGMGPCRQFGTVAARRAHPQSVRTMKSMAPSRKSCWKVPCSSTASAAGVPRRRMRTSCRYASRESSHTPAARMACSHAPRGLLPVGNPAPPLHAWCCHQRPHARTLATVQAGACMWMVPGSCGLRSRRARWVGIGRGGAAMVACWVLGAGCAQPVEAHRWL